MNPEMTARRTPLLLVTVSLANVVISSMATERSDIERELRMRLR